MRTAYLIGGALAAVIAATSIASAQRFRDDPPGWAFQRRGIIEDNGYNSLDCNLRGTCGYGYRYGWRGAYAYDRPYRNYRRDWRYYRD